jgi:hypothetical protein
MPRSLDELLAQADDLADAFEAYELTDDDRGEPPLMALRRIAYRRALVERELADAIRGARAAGVSWRQIGEAVGTTGEAARQRYLGATTTVG